MANQRTQAYPPRRASATEDAGFQSGQRWRPKCGRVWLKAVRSPRGQTNPRYPWWPPDILEYVNDEDEDDKKELVSL